MKENKGDKTKQHKTSGKKKSRFICKALSTKCPVNMLEGLLTINNKFAKNK